MEAGLSQRSRNRFNQLMNIRKINDKKTGAFILDALVTNIEKKLTKKIPFLNNIILISKI